MRKWLTVAVIGAAAVASGAAHGQGYTFKGNRLGMTLDEFRQKNLSGYEYYTRDGSIVKAGTRGSIKIAKPICTDSEYFTGDPTLAAKLASDEVVCPDESPEFAGLDYANLRYRFYKGKLYEVEAFFNSSGYEKVKNSFVAKYGPVSTTSKQDFHNDQGAHWQGEASTWRNGSQSIVLTEGPDNGPGHDTAKFRTNAGAVIRDDDLAPKAKAPKVDF